jgi:hypothetical protein
MNWWRLLGRGGGFNPDTGFSSRRRKFNTRASTEFLYVFRRGAGQRTRRSLFWLSTSPLGVFGVHFRSQPQAGFVKSKQSLDFGQLYPFHNLFPASPAGMRNAFFVSRLLLSVLSSRLGFLVEREKVEVHFPFVFANGCTVVE